MHFVSLVCLALLAFVSVDGECCKNKTIGACCGNGRCNIFCCNCDDGCNQTCETDYAAFVGTGLAAASLVGRKRRDVENMSARVVREAERFASVDVDKSGSLTLEEAASYLELHGVVRRDVGGATPSWFSKMDTNGDGLISPGEFDFSLA